MKKILIFGGIGALIYLYLKNKKSVDVVKVNDVKKLAENGKKLVENTIKEVIKTTPVIVSDPVVNIPVAQGINKDYLLDNCVKLG